MADLVVANGTVVIPGEVPRPADISITGERIAGIHEPGLAPEAAEKIDAAGLHVLPGAMDPHIHLGGYQPLEVDASPGTGLAALGGVTTLVNYFNRRMTSGVGYSRFVVVGVVCEVHAMVVASVSEAVGPAFAVVSDE